MAKLKTKTEVSEDPKAKGAKVVSSGASATDSLELIKSTLGEEKETVYIPTGNIGFDFALSEGRGLPLGASILLWADPGCGKSTLLADISRRLLDIHKSQGKPFKVLYIAAEGSRELMVSMGLQEYMKSKDFIYVERCLSWRQIEMIYDTILNGQHPVYRDVKMIIIDSVNNILSDANLEKSAADGDFGTRAKERSTFYSKYFPLCKEHEINSFLISQVRHNQETAGMMYGDKRKAAVSYADKHNVDIILKCSKSLSDGDIKETYTRTVFGKVRDKEEYIIKLTSSATDCKNRYCPGLPSEIFMVQGKGADNAYVLRKLLEANELVKAGGGWYSFAESICKKLDLPSTNMRKDVLMDLIRSNVGKVVEFLKEEGLYGLRIKDQGPAEVVKEEESPTVEDTPFVDEVLQETSEKKSTKKGSK